MTAVRPFLRAFVIGDIHTTVNVEGGTEDEADAVVMPPEDE